MEHKARSTSKLTYAEYKCFPDDGRRHEIIDGEHFVNPAPTTYHQTLSSRIHYQLYTQIDLAGLGQALYAPVDLQLSESDVVQPDLVVVLDARRRIITPTKIKGVPDLVVEIISESSATTDRTLKKELYQRSGIPEYWVVDPEDHVLEQYVLERGRYELAGKLGQEVVSRTISGVRVDLTQVW